MSENYDHNRLIASDQRLKSIVARKNVVSPAWKDKLQTMRQLRNAWFDKQFGKQFVDTHFVQLTHAQDIAEQQCVKKEFAAEHEAGGSFLNKHDNQSIGQMMRFIMMHTGKEGVPTLAQLLSEHMAVMPTFSDDVQGRFCELLWDEIRGQFDAFAQDQDTEVKHLRLADAIALAELTLEMGLALEASDYAAVDIIEPKFRACMETFVRRCSEYGWTGCHEIVDQIRSGQNTFEPESEPEEEEEEEAPEPRRKRCRFVDDEARDGTDDDEYDWRRHQTQYNEEGQKW